MDIVKCIAVIAAAAPLACGAVSQTNADQVSCSGTQTTDSTNGLQIDCIGSLTIVGGSLSSDTFIKLTASDALYLDNITLTAPSVGLTGLSVSLGNNAKIDSQNPTISSGSGPNSLPTPAPVAPDGSLTGNQFNVNTGGQISVQPGGTLQISGSGAVDRPSAPGVLTTPGNITVKTPVTLVATGANANQPPTLASNNKVHPTASACSSTGQASVFKLLESGTQFCAGGRKTFHRVQFVRTLAECHIAPAGVEIAATQDFPLDATLTKTTECHDVGGGTSSCVLYDADAIGTTQPYAGHLGLRWAKNGSIRDLAGRIIEKSADGCHSESTLKFVRRTK